MAEKKEDLKQLNLDQKLSRIQQEFKSKKSRYNTFGKYHFRSAEDIMEALKPLNAKYDVYFTVTEKYVDAGVIRSRAEIVDCFRAQDGIYADAIVGVDFDQKGMQTPQQFGSASSYGKKYALGNLLLIDDTADPDATNEHDKSDKPKKLNVGTPEFEKAKKYISGGGNLDAIKKKYTLTAAAEKQLAKL